MRGMPEPVTADNLVNRSFTGAGGLALPYRLYVPLDYVQSKRYPVLLVLHGSGEKGTDNRKQLENGVLAFCDRKLQSRHAAFVVYPQCPEGARWVEAPWKDGRYELSQVPLSKPLATALELLTALEKELSIDPHRRLISGLSMGGFGTWDAIVRHPERFAGAMPICGGGDPGQAAAAKAVPVWAFHGAKDDTVPVAGSRGDGAGASQGGGDGSLHRIPVGRAQCLGQGVRGPSRDHLVAESAAD